jgi:hypothetical protein
MQLYPDCPPPRNTNSPVEERALRAKLALLRARYDYGAVSDAVAAAIKALEVDIAWAEHRGRS